ncbi:hypothetical protein BZA05DRAFT_218249 [Tricharina praecox]|uniref:uncharacterized protein n=1 Tax=Tricharina praecox TaxID=43433 RepID=UPI00221F7E3C|nr:uncharacterized protein BZA05DRAFT_218249 [Tricharina praecox]KAI5855808.1 hypothetical protein BZA05DRAFT_218249 [Tricharina praecox]
MIAKQLALCSLHCTALHTALQCSARHSIHVIRVHMKHMNAGGGATYISVYLPAVICMIKVHARVCRYTLHCYRFHLASIPAAVAAKNKHPEEETRSKEEEKNRQIFFPIPKPETA